MGHAEKSRRESWGQTGPELGARQREILTALRQDGPMSAWELAKRLGREVYVVRPRLTELHKLDLVRIPYAKFHPETDRSEAVWAAVVTDSSGQLRLV